MRAFAQNPFMRNAMLANVKYIYALSMWSVEKRAAGWYFSKSAYQAYLARTLFERDQRDVDDRAGYLCAGRAVRASEDTNIYMRQMEALMPRIGRRIALIGFVAIALLQPALAEPPKFQVDPTWPQALPNNWIIGTIGGIFVDAQDHIWINQRPSSLDAREKRASTATNVICCVPAPPVIEFDQAGKVVQGWGWPRLQVGQRWARHLRRPQQFRLGRRQRRDWRAHLQIHPRRRVCHAAGQARHTRRVE
jgi:hypothetical protein